MGVNESMYVRVSAERVKISLDSMFGPTWHVVIGEEFAFDIDYEENMVYYALYGSHAILAWKVCEWVIGLASHSNLICLSFIQCGSVLHSDVNHIGDPETKEKLKALRRKQQEDEAAPAVVAATGTAAAGADATAAAAAAESKKNLKDYFSDRI